MKHDDEILAEVRAAREAYAARFNYDLNLICEDLRAKEQEHPGPLAQLELLNRSSGTRCISQRNSREL